MTDTPSATAIGENIRAAVAVLRETHRETSNLLGLVDGLMGEEGWGHVHVTSSNWVALTQNGAQLGQPANWLATSLRRAYMRISTNGEPKTDVLIVEVDLEPTAHSVPTLNVLALRLADPWTPREFWKRWTWTPAGCWQAGGDPGPFSLSSAELAPMLGGARATARGLSTPLCEIHRSSTRERVIEAGLALFEGLADDQAANPKESFG